MRSQVRLSFVILAVYLSFGPLAAAPNTVVATVGEKKITLSEFNTRYDQVRKQTLNPPPKDVFLEDLIRYELGVQEANRRNIDKDPIVIERIRQELYKGLIEKELGEKVKEINVTEKDMKEYYSKNPELRTSHILIEVKPEATAEEHESAKKRALEILADVRKSKRPFEELVVLYSDDSATKRNGGDIGWQTPLTILPDYYNTAYKMSVGEVSGLIETSYGFHIIKLTGRQPYDKANKRTIRAAVFDTQRKRVFDAYFARLKSKAKIEVNKSALK